MGVRMKITGSIIKGILRLDVDNGATSASIERVRLGPVLVSVTRGGVTTRGYHYTLDAAVACAQDAVTQ